MPELPEVETVKVGLKKYLIGKTIKDVEIRQPKSFLGNPEEIIGSKIIDIKRIGKGLIFELNKNVVLAAHLKMTGQFIYQDKTTSNLSLSPKTGGTLPSYYSRVIFTLDNGSKLYFNDLRRFGWIKIIPYDQVMEMPFFKEMGPEPFVGNESSPGLGVSHFTSKYLTLPYFEKIIEASNLPIKLLLMDQKKIGGIGNVYANDSLFKAGIDPRRKAKSLTSEEIKNLYKSIFFILKKALAFGGSSSENYVNALGQEGNYQYHSLVYGREGEKCRTCKGTIKKIQLGGRGTFFCEKCQK